MSCGDEGLIFANFVDFDTLWGHRNDAEGYARGLEELDSKLEPILEKLAPSDLHNYRGSRLRSNNREYRSFPGVCAFVGDQ